MSKHGIYNPEPADCPQADATPVEWVRKPDREANDREAAGITTTADVSTAGGPAEASKRRGK